jgi:hypothetical protein
MEDRICDEETSGGKFWEAISRSLNASSNRPIANLTDSEALVSSGVLRFLVRRHVGGLDITREL